MATLNAASRLRNEVLKVPHTVLLISPGHPDKVVRFNRAPEALKAYRLMKVKEISPKLQESDYVTAHTEFDLGNGPQSEAWGSICDEVKRQARRDIPTPQPEEVSPDSKTDWMMGPEEVPVVELQGQVLAAVEEVVNHPVKEVFLPKQDKRTKAYKESQKVEA